MRSPRIALVLLGFALLTPGCSDRQSPTVPEPGVDGSALRSLAAPPHLFTVGWTNEGPIQIMQIDLQSGLGTYVAELDFAGFPYLDWPIVTPFGYAFDVDGTMYAFISWGDGTEENAGSQLVRIDRTNGGMTLIGEPFPVNFAGPDIDACGDLYVTGFTVGDPANPDEYILWGGTSLWKVDKETGVGTIVGDTGAGNWMDLAFDSHGRLWTTAENRLVELDPATGAVIRDLPILGVPLADIPGVCPEDWEYMEVMTLAFDERDNLYATAMRGFSQCLETNGPVMRIEIAETEAYATLIGYTNKVYNHGGDILPQHVNLMHRKGNGQYVPMQVSMNALQAHLAHGDYVPGTPGHPCDF